MLTGGEVGLNVEKKDDIIYGRPLSIRSNNDLFKRCCLEIKEG